MFFKNLIAYRITGPLPTDELEAKLQAHAFTPCGSQELYRVGWVPPATGLSDLFSHTAHGFFMIAVKKQEKLLPPAVIKSEVGKKVEEIEHQQSRKVYRKEKDQIKEEVILDLLPRAFDTHQITYALIAPQQGWIFVDAGSHKRAEELLSYLRGSLRSLPAALPDVKQSPSAVMSHWLEKSNAKPDGITVLDEAELRDNLVEGGVLRIKGQELQDEEYLAHLEAGKRVVKLAVEWEEQLRFLVAEDLSIKRIKLTDQMKETRDQESCEDQLAQFDSDLVQMGLEFTRMFPALIEAFGGLAEQTPASTEGK